MRKKFHGHHVAFGVVPPQWQFSIMIARPEAFIRLAHRSSPSRAVRDQSISLGAPPTDSSDVSDPSDDIPVAAQPPPGGARGSSSSSKS